MTILMWAPHEQGHTLFMAQSNVLAHAETGGLLRWLPKPTKKLECSYRGTATFARESQRFGIRVGLVQSNRDLRTKCKSLSRAVAVSVPPAITTKEKCDHNFCGGNKIVPDTFWRSMVSNCREVCMGSKSISRQDDKPPAAAVPSFVFTSKKKEVSIGTEIATVSWATPALSKTVTDVPTKPAVMSAK